MLAETFLLKRSNGTISDCTDRSGEEVSTVSKLVIFFASLAITGVTAIAVAAPFALLHVR